MGPRHTDQNQLGRVLAVLGRHETGTSSVGVAAVVAPPAGPAGGISFSPVIS
jgi:hypothetical protein